MVTTTEVRPPVEKKLRKIAGAPIVLVYQHSQEVAAKNGTILFYHGLGVSKQAHLYEMGRLAKAGFLVVGIDAVGHGERRYPDYDERFEEKRSRATYYQVVRQTIDEIPAIIDELEAEGLVNQDRLGIAGISMGGYMVFGGILADKRIKVAAPIIASPFWRDVPEVSPHLHPDKFFPVALLVQNAGVDTVVKTEQARNFSKKMEPFYQTSPERLRYVEYPDAGHIMSPKDWSTVVAELVEWFEKYLPAKEIH
ncbi:MAG: prolyl oligopeptidase family serine peptidase [Deltaproteobacteria bacterium]|nr:prolyl oligopeptidase family serine peptidase [Deltaproteobacteria bacterium]